MISATEEIEIDVQPLVGPIPWAQPDFWGNEQAYVAEALRSTWISGGPFVERFEREFASRCGSRYAVAVANGTAALHAAYLALGLGPGDEVIVPGFAFQAGANMALLCGAKPIFAEVEEDTWCLSPHSVRRHLSPRTRAIVPVHTYGNVCDMNAISEIAADAGAAVIEDAAESFASEYCGKASGTFGAMGCFSFQATKTITTGEGGMIVTDDSKLYERLCLFRSHGMARRRYWHEVSGHNFRLTNLQAAVGCAQLERLDRIIRERKRVHDCYKAGLSQLTGVTMQHFGAEVSPVLWALAVRLDPKVFRQGRDGVIAQLADRGIETRPGFYAASEQPLYATDRLPVCETVAREIVSLPTFASLTADQIDRICGDLRECIQ